MCNISSAHFSQWVPLVTINLLYFLTLLKSIVWFFQPHIQQNDWYFWAVYLWTIILSTSFNVSHRLFVVCYLIPSLALPSSIVVHALCSKTTSGVWSQLINLLHGSKWLRGEKLSLDVSQCPETRRDHSGFFYNLRERDNHSWPLL